MNPSARKDRERLGAHLSAAETAIAGQDWDAARSRAREAGSAAESLGDVGALSRAATLLEKLHDLAGAAKLLAIGGCLNKPNPLPEWQGDDLTHRTLLIVQRIRDVGAPIRQARFIGKIAPKAARCIVLADHRLVPIFKRSFPTIEARSTSEGTAAAYAEADVIASYETLARYLLVDEATLYREFTPLGTDADLVEDFKRDYCRGTRSRIGISWYSTNTAKDLPPLADWVHLLRGASSTFVSLQYGDVSAAIEQLQGDSGSLVIHDPSVDQMTDLDRFAAQIAALDVVVTISNTMAHLAGALGIRTFVLLDDNWHLSWPLRGDHCAWFPMTTLVRKQGRDWSEVFAEIRGHLSSTAG